MLNYDNIRDWWDNQAKSAPQVAGTAGIAGGGIVEVIYRNYMELRHFRKLIRLHKDMLVLEMGCGAGRWALSIAPHVKQVIAVDNSPEMIRLAREKQQALGIKNVEFRLQSIQDFNSDKKFHIIYLAGVLQYITDQDMDQVIKSTSESLAVNGIVIDRSTSHEPEREIYEQDTYISVYRTVQEIQEYFARAGLHLKYNAPSYRPMRMVWLAQEPRIGKVLNILTRLFYPVSCWIIGAESWLLDRFKPIPSQQGPGRLHQFFVFKKTGNLPDERNT